MQPLTSTCRAQIDVATLGHALDLGDGDHEARSTRNRTGANGLQSQSAHSPRYLWLTGT
jgi:hypothetical protein